MKLMQEHLEMHGTEIRRAHELEAENNRNNQVYRCGNCTDTFKSSKELDRHTSLIYSGQNNALHFSNYNEEFCK